MSIQLGRLFSWHLVCRSPTARCRTIIQPLIYFRNGYKDSCLIWYDDNIWLCSLCLIMMIGQFAINIVVMRLFRYFRPPITKWPTSFSTHILPCQPMASSRSRDRWSGMAPQNTGWVIRGWEIRQDKITYFFTSALTFKRVLYLRIVLDTHTDVCM